MVKKSLLAASFTLIVAGTATPTWALTFCPAGDGSTTQASCVSFVNLDQAPGNAIADAFAGTSEGDAFNFNVFYQANMEQAGSFSNGDGGNFFTFVLGFQEFISDNSVVGTTGPLTFGYSADNPAAISNDPLDPNFFYMYKVPGFASNLTGLGFVPAAGPPNPILSGHTIPDDYLSGFFLSGFAPPDAVECGPADIDVGGPATPGNPGCLDQGETAGGAGFGLNNYPLTETLRGGGIVSLKIAIDTINPDYFPDLPLSAIIVLDTTSFTSDPYEDIDPSAVFSPTGLVNGGKAGVPSVGPINALTGPSTMFETDAVSSFVVTQVPEPAMLLLLGVGLVGTAAAARRRQNRSQQKQNK